MADRPTAKREGTHHENVKHEEAYQPLWDTDQSVPEYMTLLMGEQTQQNEDAELYEDSEEEEYEELEHPDPDYEYVYPGAPKRYDSARKDSEDEEPEYEDAEYEDVEYEEYDSEPSNNADDNENDTENSQDNQSVALDSTQPAQAAEPTQPALSACEGTTENTGRLTAEGTQAQSPQEPTKPSTIDTSPYLWQRNLSMAPPTRTCSPCSYWAHYRVMPGLRSWLPCAGRISPAPLWLCLHWACLHREKTPAKLGLLATSPRVHRKPPWIGLKLGGVTYPG